MSRVIYFHTATADAATNNYADIATGTVTALTGHAVSGAIEVIIVGMVRKSEIEQIEYLGGELSSVNIRRRQFQMEFKEFTYRASTWDEGDMETLIDTIFASEFLWLDLSEWQTTTNRAVNYHDSGKLIPVVITDYSIEINAENATKKLTATISHRWRNV